MKTDALSISLPLTALLLASSAVRGQTVPPPVPAEDVFTLEQIGHALADPTPDAGKAAPSAANAPEDDGQWTMPAKNFAATRFSSLTELTANNVKGLQPVLTFSL